MSSSANFISSVSLFLLQIEGVCGRKCWERTTFDLGLFRKEDWLLLTEAALEKRPDCEPTRSSFDANVECIFFFSSVNIALKKRIRKTIIKHTCF